MMSIGLGFLLTLAVSFFVGFVTPGEQVTLQISARWSPNILDLLIALCSAAAAAYALARPSIAGAVAGVAIATALVPPLCSAGISLAYREFLGAQGAALLFLTNLVAIVMGAAITFRLLGVTFSRADATQRHWGYRVGAAAGVGLILLAFPLQRALNDVVDRGRAQPRTYPLTKSVEEALVHYVERSPNLELVATGRPSVQNERADVVIVLSSSEPLPQAYSNHLVEICRKEMGDSELVVQVHCFLDAWQPDESEETE